VECLRRAGGLGNNFTKGGGKMGLLVGEGTGVVRSVRLKRISNKRLTKNNPPQNTSGPAHLEPHFFPAVFRELTY